MGRHKDKEWKDGKERKEGKEGKDWKERKEGKEYKEGKEHGKEWKERDSVGSWMPSEELSDMSLPFDGGGSHFITGEERPEVGESALMHDDNT